MNILMLLYKDFPPDIRVEKEVKSLTKAGHNVYILAKSDSNTTYRERWKNAEIINIPKRNLFEKISFLIIKKNISLIKKLKDLIKKYSIDVLHVHDSPLLKIAYLATQDFRNVKLVADLHENMPAALKCYYQTNKKGILRKIKYNIFNNYNKYKKYEIKYLSYFNKIIFVTKEAKERFKKEKQILNNSEIISNVVDFSNFKNKKIYKNIKEKYKENFVISYIGGFGIHRGIDTTIKAMKHIKKKDILLLLVGARGSYAEKMKELINKNDLNSKIELIEWVDFKKIYTYNYISEICLIPHNMFEHTDTTIPHKMFQYMYFKKPLIVSNCRPLKRIIDKTNSGLIFEANNEKDLAKKIIKLYNNRNLRREMGNNGYKAVLEKYNWERESRKLLNIYNNI